MEAVKNAKGSEVMTSYQKRLANIQKKIAGKIGTDVEYSFEVQELIGEYDFVAKQLYQMDDVSKLMSEIVKGYKTNQDIQSAFDPIYGDGSTAYLAEAIEAFYQKK